MWFSVLLGISGICVFNILLFACDTQCLVNSFWYLKLHPGNTLSGTPSLEDILPWVWEPTRFLLCCELTEAGSLLPPHPPPSTQGFQLPWGSGITLCLGFPPTTLPQGSILSALFYLPVCPRAPHIDSSFYIQPTLTAPAQKSPRDPRIHSIPASSQFLPSRSKPN